MRGCTKRLEAAIVAVFIVFASGCSPLHTATPVQQPPVPRVREMRPEQQSVAPAGQVEVPYIAPPTSIDLCGEPVPLDREAVYERFDKEFTLIVYNHAQVYLWLKRMQRYFPMVEQRLRYYGLPDDLKYVAIVESDLLPNACSPKGAAGPWQFMAGTGAAYGLAQCGSVDNRFNFQRATDSAFMLLKNLDDKYHSWALALAAYNSGDKRVLDAMRVAGTRDYYDLCLPLETEHYVVRILAIKAVLSDPARYGYNLPAEYGYRPVQTDRVTVTLSGPVSITTIAGAAGTTYSEIKRLNPVFRSEDVPAGTYDINLPHGSRDAFERNFKSGSTGVMPAHAQAAPAYVPPRAARERSHVAARNGRPVRVASRKTGQKTRLAKGRKAPAAKARAHREKGKGRPAKPVSHKGGGKAGHKKSKPHRG